MRLLQGHSYLPDRHRFTDGMELLFDRKGLDFAATPARPDDPRVVTMSSTLSKLRSLVAANGATLLVVLIPEQGRSVRGAGSQAGGQHRRPDAAAAGTG